MASYSQTSHIDVQNILDELETAKLVSNKLQVFLASYPDQNVPKYLFSLERSLHRIRYTLLKPQQDEATKKIQTKNSSMKKLSLLDILKKSIPKNLPPSVTIDLPSSDVQIFGHMYKLIVLFSNLIENSIQAMGKNGTIKIKGTQLADRVRIDVIDSGPGIPDKVLNKLFFSLATTKQHGTGLGTKMAKSIVELHGGKISVRNHPTTFTIELPLEKN